MLDHCCSCTAMVPDPLRAGPQGLLLSGLELLASAVDIPGDAGNYSSLEFMPGQHKRLVVTKHKQKIRSMRVMSHEGNVA